VIFFAKGTRNWDSPSEERENEDYPSVPEHISRFEKTPKLKRLGKDVWGLV
jgi:hypothetical protein